MSKFNTIAQFTLLLIFGILSFYDVEEKSKIEAKT